MPTQSDVGDLEQKDLYNFNGRWLFLDRSLKTLVEAKAECERRNMVLAQFANIHEFEALKSVFSVPGNVFNAQGL